MSTQAATTPSPAVRVDAMAQQPRWDPARFPPAVDESRLRSTVRFNRDPLGLLEEGRRRHGSVFSLRLLPYQALVCAVSAETNQAVLTDAERFAAGDAAGLIEPLVGAHSLILTPSPRHLGNRKRLLPPFHGERVAAWTDRVAATAVAHRPRLLTGEPVAIRPWAQRLTLEVILQVVFGVTDPERVGRYRVALDRLLDPKFMPFLFLPDRLKVDLGPLSPFGQFLRRRRAVDDLLYAEIAARRAAPDAHARDDVLSVLLQADFTDVELRDELMGLVVAGHETTATALAWTLHLLAHHPDAADRAAEDDPYLRAVIKESTRMRAPVIDAIRTAVDDTELGGRPVPKGAFVSAMFCATHHDPALWPEPGRFRPERHLDARPTPYALTPFGGGVRRCIGAALAQLELEVVLREVLSVAVPHPAGAPERVRLNGITLVPAAGGRVRLRAR